MATESKFTVSSGMKLFVFFLIELALYCFGDLFTFIVGTLIMILIFANGYDREQAENHGHHDHADTH